MRRLAALVVIAAALGAVAEIGPPGQPQPTGVFPAYH